MKTKITFYAIVLMASSLALTHCTGKKQEQAHDEHAAQQTETHDAVAEPQFKVDASFQNQLAGVFTSYVAMKDAFVSSDAAKVKEQAATTDAALQQVDMKLLSGAAHNDWMTYLTPIQVSLKEIQSAPDLAAQRKAFSTLSDNLYKASKLLDLVARTLTMNFARWLSTTRVHTG